MRRSLRASSIRAAAMILAGSALASRAPSCRGRTLMSSSLWSLSSSAISLAEVFAAGPRQRARPHSCHVGLAGVLATCFADSVASSHTPCELLSPAEPPRIEHSAPRPPTSPWPPPDRSLASDHRGFSAVFVGLSRLWPSAPKASGSPCFPTRCFLLHGASALGRIPWFHHRAPVDTGAAAQQTMTCLRRPQVQLQVEVQLRHWVGQPMAGEICGRRVWDSAAVETALAGELPTTPLLAMPSSAESQKPGEEKSDNLQFGRRNVRNGATLGLNASELLGRNSFTEDEFYFVALLSPQTCELNFFSSFWSSFSIQAPHG
eukprot:scaffold7039_cov255-Pinguiococcus_pyrenoidosus.AAC.15